jgi:hypothetical protein
VAGLVREMRRSDEPRSSNPARCELEYVGGYVRDPPFVSVIAGVVESPLAGFGASAGEGSDE